MAAKSVSTPRQTPPVTIITSRRIAVATALLTLSGAAVRNHEETPNDINQLSSQQMVRFQGNGHPDAALIALCTEFGVHHNRFNNESVGDARLCPIWAEYTRCADAIAKAEPQTLSGMVAKARAAKLVATEPDGEEEPEGTEASVWAWDLVNDLIRLGGRA